MIYRRQTTAKAFDKDAFINQERKLGDRRCLDTVVVSTINDVNQGSGLDDGCLSGHLRVKTEYLHSGGSMVARLKLKGIDGHYED